MVHPGRRGAVSPAIKQSLAGIDDAKAIGRDTRITKQPCRDVHAMNPTTDDQPLQTLLSSSPGPLRSASLLGREFMVSAGLHGSNLAVVSDTGMPLV